MSATDLFSKGLPEARSPADAEGDDPLVVEELSGLLVDEAVGPKRSRHLPVGGVVHDVVQIGEHLQNRIDNSTVVGQKANSRYFLHHCNLTLKHKLRCTDLGE